MKGMTNFDVTVRAPKPGKVTCVRCGARINHDGAHMVEVRYTTPYITEPRTIDGLTDGWSYSWIDNLQASSLNASATAVYGWSPAGYVEPTPTSLYHTHSGYACSKEHAEQGAELLRAKLAE